MTEYIRLKAPNFKKGTTMTRDATATKIVTATAPDYIICGKESELTKQMKRGGITKMGATTTVQGNYKTARNPTYVQVTDAKTVQSKNSAYVGDTTKDQGKASTYIKVKDPTIMPKSMAESERKNVIGQQYIMFNKTVSKNTVNATATKRKPAYIEEREIDATTGVTKNSDELKQPYLLTNTAKDAYLLASAANDKKGEFADEVSIKMTKTEKGKTLASTSPTSVTGRSTVFSEMNSQRTARSAKSGKGTQITGTTTTFPTAVEVKQNRGRRRIIIIIAAVSVAVGVLVSVIVVVLLSTQSESKSDYNSKIVRETMHITRSS